MLVLVVVAVILFFYREQNAFSMTFYRLTTHKFHSTQGQIRIVQLSDLHSKTFGRKNKRLINKIKRLNPDLIFATGDLISSTDTNGGAFLDLIDGLKGQYPLSAISFLNSALQKSEKCYRQDNVFHRIGLQTSME